MEVQQILIGSNPDAKISYIPDMCTKERTITLNKMKQLHIFKDKRPTAQAWINENLPRLLITDTPDKFVNWFWHEMPDNGFLEFDFGKKTLHLCILQKK